jgi:threonyl-tRNA synthetase
VVLVFKLRKKINAPNRGIFKFILLSAKIKNMDKKPKKEKNLFAMRHSAEHVLTQAMLKLYPGLKMAMGPATEEGFYFDFEYKNRITPEDFPKIEAEMKKIVKQNLPIKKKALDFSEAKKLFKNNSYKQEWLSDIKKRKQKPTVCWTGKEFVDLCAGPHLKLTGEIGPFKLLSIAGAYWHGDEKNKMLTRIYGTCFPTQKELDHWLWQQEEAQKRDHRFLGQQLGLFIFDDEVGQGLPLWMPKGAWLKYIIQNFALDTYLKRGYEPVSTPHIASSKLWGHSGHLDFYKESMYNSFGIEEEEYLLKPMNCPFHVRMYLSQKHSYKELPIRWTEMGTVYRYERSGTLHGLVRVRGFTQDDAHIICTPEQLPDEVFRALNLTLYMLRIFGFKDFEVNLSARSPKEKKKFIGSDKQWKMAESILRAVLKRTHFNNFIYDVGGAVFYGPKIDIKVADTLGRKWQLSTIQFDFNLPNRFGMTYTDSDGKERTPYMIHRALLGSLERFIGVLIEFYGGAFPVWLSPVQVVVMPLGLKHLSFAEKVVKQLKSLEIRAELWDEDSISKRIRNAELKKIPYVAVVGDKEIKSDSVAVRQHGKGDLGAVKVEKFIKQLLEEIEKKK